MRQLAVANGPNIFQMLLVNHLQLLESILSKIAVIFGVTARPNVYVTAREKMSQ